MRRVYPGQNPTDREAAEYVRGHMQPPDIRFLVDDEETREAYFVIYRAPSVELNKELGNG
jgi:hypothetical protein